MKHAIRNRKRSSRTGAAMVEFAIVATVMFPLILACLEFVRVGMLESMAEDAAYTAARFIMVPGATKQDAIDKANEVMGRIGARGVSVSVVALDKDGVAQSEIDDSTARIEVEIQVPLSQNTFTLTHFTRGKVVTATTSMRFESYDGYYDGSSS